MNYLESFFFIMMGISPALIGIPLQILATRKKQELSWSFLINCRRNFLVRLGFINVVGGRSFLCQLDLGGMLHRIGFLNSAPRKNTYGAYQGAP
ncbi:hypothetical protein [Bacillus sp. FJAT-29937]|uniref:hypothetical protein n=1 Tax=Bacillus sp. FJAT-29937 TaxID=1720553 RepID=UPI00082C9829|nr:hypothetical protein [Bacillus sp. FJAT-29937]